jgi:hypothetical protein
VDVVIAISVAFVGFAALRGPHPSRRFVFLILVFEFFRRQLLLGREPA